MIQPIEINTINFGYKSILKTLYLDGKLPQVKFDIYGKKLTPKNVSIEHIIPKSKGGKSNLSNYALANVIDNSARGSKNLLAFTTIDNIKTWFSQFIDIDLPEFNGKKYIDNCAKTLKKINIEV